MRVRLLVVTAIAAAACGGSDSSAVTPPNNTSKTIDVATVATAFSPNSVTINAGDSVRFSIVPAPDGDGHDVTFDQKTGAPPNINMTSRGVITRGFTTRGTFHYNCFVHPGMSGDIIVQ
jgi:plastocyanin